jgi:cell division protein ZapA
MTKAADSKGIAISVMGREFRVAATAGEERQLMASVDLLNRKMKEIRDTGKVVGNERIAIMAALNLAHENLHTAPSATASAQIDGENKSSSTLVTIDEAYIRGRINTFESILEKAVSEQEKLF